MTIGSMNYFYSKNSKSFIWPLSCKHKDERVGLCFLLLEYLPQGSSSRNHQVKGGVLITKPDSQESNQRGMRGFPSAPKSMVGAGLKEFLSHFLGDARPCAGPHGCRCRFSPDKQWGSLMRLPREEREFLLERPGTFFSEPERIALFIIGLSICREHLDHTGCPKARNCPHKSSRAQEPRFLQ